MERVRLSRIGRVESGYPSGGQAPALQVPYGTPSRSLRVPQVIWTVFVGVLLLIGCASSGPASVTQGKVVEAPPSAQQEAGPARKQEPKMERVKLNVSHTSGGAGQASVAVVKEAGFFDKYGLDVNLVLMSGGTKAMQAMVGGEVPISIMGGSSMIEVALAGVDAVMFVTLQPRLTHVLVAKSDIKSPQGLKGKRIAVSRIGSLDDFAARVALRKWGMEPDRDAAMLQIGEQPARLAALEAGASDATLISPPLNIIARKKGYNEFPLSELNIEYPLSCLVATKTYIGKNEDVIRRFVSAFVEGIHFIKTNKQATAKTIQTFMGLDDVEAVEETYDGLVKIIPDAPYPSVKGVQTVLDDLTATNEKAKQAKAEDFVDARFVRELDESGFIKKLYGK